MNLFVICAIVQCLSGGFAAGGTHQLSPLTNVRPGKALAEHLLHRMSFVSQIVQEKVLENFTSVEDFLIQDAVNQDCLGANCSTCVQSLVDLSLDINEKKTYTYQVIDATGKLESGLLLGNIKWLGRYYQCLHTNVSDFKGKWCGVFLGQEIPGFVGVSIGITLGTCLPDVCKEDYINSRLQPLLNRSHTSLSIECPEQPTVWSSIDIFSLLLAIILIGLLVAGTLCEMVVISERKRATKGLSVSSDGIIEETIQREMEEQQSKLSRLAISFSIIKNTQKLLDTSSRTGTISALHGLRFFSITWVILGHTYVLSLIYLENPVDVANWYLNTFSFQTVSNSFFAVDSFFFLSGTLVTYLGLREMSRRDGRLSVLLMYIHRYMRITPAYAFLILFVVGMFNKLGDGPNWPALIESQREACSKYWWTNLLYINNLHPSSLTEECFAWGWYLANDMQFFILAPISIILLYRFPKAGVSMLITGLLLSWMVTGVLSKHFHQQPESVMIAQLMRQVLSGNPKHTFIPSLHDMKMPVNTTTEDTFWGDLYTKPWCRIGPYIIGIFSGYILYDTKCKIRMNKMCIAGGWILAISLNLSVLYGLWQYIDNDVVMPLEVAALYNSLSRTVWALGLAWVTVSCACGHGGPINTILSSKIFYPLSRLTFSVYLVHPLIIFLYNASQETPYNFSNMDFVAYYIAFVVLSYIAAYLLYILVEAPIVNLQKVVFLHRREEPEMNDVGQTFLVDEVIQPTDAQ